MVTAASAEPRAVNPALMLGLVALPIVFVWFLFLPGYSWSLRVAALSYTFVYPAVFLLGMLFSLILHSLG